MAWETTQPTLLSRVRDPADHAAWREFDQRYGDLVTNFARSRGLQTSDAEDIRQIVMLNLSRALRQFEYQPEKGKFRSYLGRTVRNTISQWLARPSRADRALDSFVIDTTPQNDAHHDAAPELEQAWEDEWMNHHLRIAMRIVRASVEPQSIEVFNQLLAGITVQNVADEFNLTTQAVHKIKQRIRDRLKQQVAAQIHDEENINSGKRDG